MTSSPRRHRRQGLEARDRVQAMLQQRLARDFPDVTARVSRLELGPPVGWPVQYRVSAPTTEEARHYAERLDVLRGQATCASQL